MVCGGSKENRNQTIFGWPQTDQQLQNLKKKKTHDYGTMLQRKYSPQTRNQAQENSGPQSYRQYYNTPQDISQIESDIR